MNVSQANIKNKLYSLIHNIPENQLIGGSKKLNINISATDEYEAYLGIQLKNNPQGSFMQKLYQNINEINSQEELHKFIEDNFMFYNI